MTHPGGRPWIDEVASEVISVFGFGRQVKPFSGRRAGFTLADAYEVAERVREIRAARGETAIGRKIGFTNRTVWGGLGISAPIWGYMYDTTVRDLSGTDARFALAGLAEPRIEPEIVLHLADVPHPEMSDEDLIACVDWIAHGFEIVDSIYPGWAFGAPDAVAAHGLHGTLLIGKRHLISHDRRLWGEALSGFTIEMLRDGDVVARGHGQDVLGGPVQALRFLARQVACSPACRPLRPGEIVTTGTLTAAMPVAHGETWTTVLKGVEAGGLRLRFE
jgi:2-oxo-3-hexenedioate decarboxylase